jgi:hypothetical protein
MPGAISVTGVADTNENGFSQNGMQDDNGMKPRFSMETIN